jgi:maltooligosyltrehalose synthase
VVAGRWFLDAADDDGTLLQLPAGRWRNVYTDTTCEGATSVATILGGLPAALLVRS